MSLKDRFLGPSGVRTAPLAFGTMTFGAGADAATSRALFARARAAGINLFDCANTYAQGESEAILGELIKGCRDEVLITTKAYFPIAEDRNARGLSRRHLRLSVEASLRRLKTDRIDLFFLHRFDEETALWETLRAIDDLVRAGAIVSYGLSNFAAWQAMKALGICEREGFTRPIALQPMYNLLKRQAEVELLPMAASEGLAVLPYSPLAAGLLTGKYRRGETGRIRENKVYEIRYGDEAQGDIAEAFVDLAAELGVAPAALAVRWVAANPAVTAPIIGARNLSQLEGVLPALELEMDAALYERIAALTPTPPPATDRNEERTAHTYGAR